MTNTFFTANETEQQKNAFRAGCTGNVALLNTLKDKTLINEYCSGAALTGHTELVRQCLNMGADPDSGLHGAAGNGHLHIVHFLLEQGADPNRGLAAAAEVGHADISRLLLNYGADPNCGLINAAYNGHADIVTLLLTRPGIDVNQKDALGKTPLDYATEAGHTNVVRLLNTHLLLESSEKYNLYDLLRNAVKEDNTNLVELLIHKGADHNYGFSAAAENGNMEMVQFLLSKGADPNYGFSAAVKNGNMEMVQFLLDKGADPYYGLSAAAENGNMEMMQFLLSKGATNYNDGLSVAARSGNMEIVRLLLNEGADPSTGLSTAARNGNMEMVQLLLSKGATNYNDGFYAAVSAGHTDLVRLFFNRGLTKFEYKQHKQYDSFDIYDYFFWPNIRNVHIEIVELLLDHLGTYSSYISATRLDEAVEAGRRDIVRIMLDKGVKWDKGLRKAAAAGLLDIVELFLENRKYDIAYLNQALYEAAKGGQWHIIQFCIDKGANNFNYALESAAEGGHLDIVQFCIDKGADNFGAALKSAAEGGHLDIVQFLLDKGADPNHGFKNTETFNLFSLSPWEVFTPDTSVLDDFKDTPLYHAAEGGHKDIVQLLLDKGAYLNGGICGAASGGYSHIVRLLVDKGANPRIGLTVAAEKGHWDAVKLLLALPGTNENRDLNVFQTAIVCAAQAARWDILRLLLDKGTASDNGHT